MHVTHPVAEAQESANNCKSHICTQRDIPEAHVRECSKEKELQRTKARRNKQKKKRKSHHRAIGDVHEVTHVPSGGREMA